MKTLVIHIGMHKTGSSSIQQTFASCSFDDLEYLDLGSPNHSGFFATLFWDKPENYHGNIKAGRGKEEVYRLRDRYKELLIDRVLNAKKSKIMISAEDLSHPASIERVERLKNFFDPYVDKFVVYGYVRSPVSYMESAFQQVVKGGVGFFDLNRIYPKYRARFEPYYKVFGRDSVNLIPFDRERLYENDVVLDLANRLGESIAKEKVIKVNESLSVEATSLLYVYRKYGPGYGAYKGAAGDNNKLVELLRQVGRGKVKFHRDLVFPVLDGNKDDLAWVGETTGYCYDEAYCVSPDAISSEQSLIDMACANSKEVVKVLEQACMNDITPKNIAMFIDALRFYASGRLPRASETTDIWGGIETLLEVKDDIAPVAVFRELALCLERSGRYEQALKIVKAGMRVNSKAPGLTAIYERLSAN